MLGVSVLFAGGTVLSTSCMNTVASIPLCGTVFHWCTPADQLNLFLPVIDVPDYDTDPSCTLPMGCGAGDLYNDIPPGFPGGSGVVQPTDDQGGGPGADGGGG